MTAIKGAWTCGLALGLALLAAQSAGAAIYNWQTGQVIPGTETITPQPGVYLRNWNTASHNLEYGEFSGADLTGSTFRFSWLDYAHFIGANLTSADLTGATLTGADLTDAIVQKTGFGSTTSRGFTKEQLYTTASWKAKDLTGIWLTSNNLSGWNLAGHNMTSANVENAAMTNTNLCGANLTLARLAWAVLTSADLSGANLTSADLSYATLTGADFSDAIVQKTGFGTTTSRGFTKEQLYSTASWKAKNLTGIRLWDNNLTEWNLAGQNLTSAYCDHATLTGTDLTDAIVRGAYLGNTTSRGFTQEQLYSTASWKAKDLTGIGLGSNNLAGWNFAGQNLTSADLSATLTGADLTDAIVRGADFGYATFHGFTKEQLYSTASWKEKDLTRIQLDGDHLSGWNLAGQNLTSAYLYDAVLTGADLTLADLRKAQWASLTGAITRNTILPDGTVAGLNLLAGDTLVIRNCDLGITVQIAMTYDPAAVIEFRLDGGAWGSTITPAAGVVPDLGGTLELGFADGVDPTLLVGETFDLFDWGEPLDTANRFDSVRSQSWASWDLGDLYSTGEVTLLAVPEPATLSLMALGGLLALRRRGRHGG